jgi:hypothetical protein
VVERSASFDSFSRAQPPLVLGQFLAGEIQASRNTWRFVLTGAATYLDGLNQEQRSAVEHGVTGDSTAGPASSRASLAAPIGRLPMSIERNMFWKAEVRQMLAGEGWAGRGGGKAQKIFSQQVRFADRASAASRSDRQENREARTMPTLGARSFGGSRTDGA